MKTNYQLKLFLFAAFILVMSSCKKQNLGDLPDQSSLQTISKSQLLPPQAYAPGDGQQITYNMKNGSVIKLQKVNDDYVLSGDIILSKKQLKYIQDNSVIGKPSIQSIIKTQSTFISDFNKLWTSGIVYYVISNPVNQTAINSAISYWNSNTQIQLVPRTNQTNYVQFQSGAGSGQAGNSNLGMIGGEQYINLADGVDVGSIIHEIGHTVGLLHEQTRSDRDGYINVNYTNINSNWTSQYDKYTGLSGYEIGTFDFQSIMLYDSYYPQVGYQGNSTPQMTKVSDNSTFTAQRSYLSSGDIIGVNYLYFNGTFARIRYVTTYDGSNEYETNIQQDVYVDLFQDAACTIPKSLVQNVRFNYINDMQVYNNNQVYNDAYTSNYINLTAGNNSYYIASQSTDLRFGSQGETQSGSYNEINVGSGGVGYILKY